MIARNKAKIASETELSMSCELTYLVSARQRMPHSFPSLGSHRDESGNSLLSATPHPRYSHTFGPVSMSYPEADPSGKEPGSRLRDT